MFFKNSSAKKEKEIKNTEGEGSEGKEDRGKTEREPCERCGSLEHIACIRPF